MPILDPSSQYSLTSICKMHFLKDKNGGIYFYLRYLRIASRNILRNFSTIVTSMRFRGDLLNACQICHELFKCQLNTNDFNNPTITNFYQYLYSKIGKTVNPQVYGKYFSIQCNNNIKINYFLPNFFDVAGRCWFLTDTSVAILAISNYSKSYNHLFFFEIDLMAAAGFTLVLCGDFDKDNILHFFNMVKRDQFAEIHININSPDQMSIFLQESKNHNYTPFESFKGFFYLYCPFIDSSNTEELQIYKKMKNLHRFTFVQFAKPICKSLKTQLVEEIGPFPYCKNGFVHEKLRIFLTNVPIYDTRSENCHSKVIPSETVEFAICHISPKDFLNWKKGLIEILLEDRKNNRCFKKSIKFADIHKIKKDFFVQDPLSIAKTQEKMIQTIDNIENKVNQIIKERQNKEINKKTFFSTLKSSIEYVACVYTHCSRSLIDDFSIHRPQIYTVFEACNKLLGKDEIDMKKYVNELKRIDSYLSFKETDYLKDVDKNKPEIRRVFNKIKSEFLVNIPLLVQWKRRIFGKPRNYIDLMAKDKDQEIKETFDDYFRNRKAEIEEIIRKNKETKSKGMIYQVETGEGKSCIIALIAAILALNKKTVHIASSNIKLANRDYINSFDFIQKLKLRSAVFLHENELPTSAMNKMTKKVAASDANANNYDINNERDDEDDDRLDEIINLADHDFFKENADNYYNTHHDKAEYAKYYTNQNYYGPEQFENELKMNFGVCGVDTNNAIPKKKPNIIFSTFVNFECFYLKMMELCPGYIDEYYENCALIIDEADSILLDERANGTIISKEMKSDFKETLKFVYDQRSKMKPNEIFEVIKDKCGDLTLKDVERMYSEIDLVNRPDFTADNKYSIESVFVKNKKKKKRLISEALNLASKNVKDDEENDNKNDEEDNGDDNNDDDDDDDNDDDNGVGDDDEEEEEEEEDQKLEEEEDNEIEFKYIVPYDSANKGILEPNKEFSGFIQQFIAIKESKNKENKNIIIKDMSINYLYISHPIFVNQYSKVCGLTGTIGTRSDKDIYKENYDLKTKRIPRNKANYRIEFPMLLCDGIKERNKRITLETLDFHKRGNPVLVIFQDLNEIRDVSDMLHSEGIKYINIFDGKNDEVRPDLIAGIEGAVSLGTNFCGRGTNIIAKRKPLHVIISYYSKNQRVMDQARGRTARQGQRGTVRIICDVEQYIKPNEVDETEIEDVLNEFSIKDQMQSEYIRFFMDTKPWIFEKKIDKQTISNEHIELMRKAQINVNRIVAYNYKFPLKMSVDTFLKIQIQKIFSLVNCPNCAHTWRLFQRYVREMILESWSLMINSFDEEYFEENKKNQNQVKKFISDIDKYRKDLSVRKFNLIIKLLEYLPLNEREIVPLFINIFHKVIDQYQETILKSYQLMANSYYQSESDGNKFLTVQIGFKPYSLLSESGARISYNNLGKMNYICDPELKYIKIKPTGLFRLSITEKIDRLFNFIFQKINKFLGEKTFLKFFMRRTLFGCEFGVCLDFLFKNEGIDDKYCMVDRDPLLLFTINVKSIKPILAGVLIFLLAFVAILSKRFVTWFFAFSGKITKEVIKRGACAVINVVAPELINFALDKFIKFLNKTLEKQINILKKIDNEKAKLASVIIKCILEAFESNIGDSLSNNLCNFLGAKIKAVLDWQKLLKSCFDPKRVMKISVLLLLCMASFMMNFNFRKDSIAYSVKDSSVYESSFEVNDDNNDNNKNIVKRNVKEAINSLRDKDEKEINEEEEEINEEEEEINEEDMNEEEMVEGVKQSSNEIIESYDYKAYSLNPLKCVKKITNIAENIEENYQRIQKGVAVIRMIVRGNKEKLMQMTYNELKKQFIKQMRFYLTNKTHSIVNVIGYNVGDGKQSIIVQNDLMCNLNEFFLQADHQKVTPTNKLIIAFGIACAMKLLHEHGIAHRYLIPDVIMLDSKLQPHVSEFHYSKHIKTVIHYDFKKRSTYTTRNEKFDIYFFDDVYSYGLLLFTLVTEQNPFIDLEKPQNAKLPEFPGNVSMNWKRLISDCCNEIPKNRPSFIDIYNTLLSNIFVNESIDEKEFMKYKDLFN